MNLPAKEDPRFLVVLRAVPTAPRMDADAIAAEVIAFADEAQKAVTVSERAVIDTAKAAGDAADVLRAINRSTKKLTEARTTRLASARELITKLSNLYVAAEGNYAKAKKAIEAKVADWRKAEEARVIAESAERKVRRAELAAAAAATQAALGDADGAQQIIEEAAAVVDAAPKIQATGMYGASLSVTRRNVGKVTDLRVFLAALATSQADEMVAILNRLELPQTQLNKLAAAVNEGRALCPAGFLGDVDTKDVVR